MRYLQIACAFLWFSSRFACAQVVLIDFETQVLPILEEHCVACHGSDVQESKLRLDSLVDALRGGDSGEAVIRPGNSSQSHLIERVSTSDKQLQMPPDAELLESADVELLRRWIDDSQQWSAAQAVLAEEKPQHWSFQAVQRPDVPKSECTHPIDSFVEQRLRAAGLAMSATAEKRRLIRRLYLVMHGLPPTPEQVSAFIDDTSEESWSRLVDSVLESPRYGERFASLWLDLIRFGETNGYETNRERPNAYPYRDWVIAAFNDDKPYDRFVREQIAGDALSEPVGTGFLVAGPNDIVKGQDALLGLMQRQDELADMVNATGTAFLGLTTGCARCHNHKFDPISQADYYAMQAVFAGVEHAEREVPLSADVQMQVKENAKRIARMRTALAKHSKSAGIREPVNAVENFEIFEPTEARFLRFTIDDTSGGEPCIDELQVFVGDENVALASAGAKASSSGDFVHPFHKLEHLIDGQFGNGRSWIASKRAGVWAQVEFAKPVLIERVVWGRDRERKFADRLATEYRIELSLDGDKWKEVASSKDRRPVKHVETSIDNFELKGLSPEEADAVRAEVARLREAEEEQRRFVSSSRVYAGAFNQPGPTRRLYRGDPTTPREEIAPGAIATLASLSLQIDAPEQQRRLALANWIASRDNPLTARVLVNRVWQFHFGTGIVDTPSDLGANGTQPTHPELLDWLACELMDSGWSVKKLHRLILSSRTWRQDSRPREAGMNADASSRLLWRFPTRRLEAEGIRDCILAATGKLDLRVGGPGFSAFEVELENVRHYFPKADYGPEDWRRMVYMTKVRMEKDSVFGVFDCPDGSQVTPRRSRSTTPLQALNLLNSRFVLQQAEMLAERVHRERESTAEQVAYVYELSFGREVRNDELEDAVAFIQRFGWVQFARALLNANEFVFIP